MLNVLYRNRKISITYICNLYNLIDIFKKKNNRYNIILDYIYK